jgi:putative endopeptidase
MLIASTWRHREEMKRIGRGNADRRWDVLPQDPSLAYDITQNRLIVSAAMLQPPVYDTTKDAAWLYGSYGALVGHELSHGFDNRGRYVDARQELRDWWTPAEASAWDALSRRVATQYGAFDYPDLSGVKVNGVQTADENIADLTGVQLAWAALRNAEPSAGKPQQQSFYTGWASLWPQHMTREAAQQRAATSVHAPGKWRTNGPLRNEATFGETFACKAGNAMQLAADQQVRLFP